MAKAKGSGRLFTPMRKDGTFEFTYKPSFSTDIRKTFEKARAEQSADQQVKNVTPIKRSR